MMKLQKCVAVLFVGLALTIMVQGFAGSNNSNKMVHNHAYSAFWLSSHPPSFSKCMATEPSTSSTDTASGTLEMKVKSRVDELKKVLEREYLSFFDPMEREYYSKSVTFEDPMTSLSGVDSYQQNVDMLSSRTLMGSLLFEDASISLHSVDGGDISISNNNEVQVSNIITRWTLRVCAKVLPWKPTARFSGISVYDVESTNNGDEGDISIKITKQIDYWDSINIRPNSNGSYQKVDKQIAIQDFLNQLKPDNNFNAPSAAGFELPYQLLRRGNGYQVRKYPAFVGVQLPYERRDEAFSILGSFTNGMVPLSPAIIDVHEKVKFMTWPLDYLPPSESGDDDGSSSKVYQQAKEKIEKDPRWSQQNCKIVTMPGQVVAVKCYSDASVEPIVRRMDAELREECIRDGIKITPTNTNDDDLKKGNLKFAQYDAIFSMGKRRGEVWIPLEECNHPW